MFKRASTAPARKQTTPGWTAPAPSPKDAGPALVRFADRNFVVDPTAHASQVADVRRRYRRRAGGVVAALVAGIVVAAAFATFAVNALLLLVTDPEAFLHGSGVPPFTWGGWIAAVAVAVTVANFAADEFDVRVDDTTCLRLVPGAAFKTLEGVCDDGPRSAFRALLNAAEVHPVGGQLHWVVWELACVETADRTAPYRDSAAAARATDETDVQERFTAAKKLVKERRTELKQVMEDLVVIPQQPARRQAARDAVAAFEEQLRPLTR